MSLLYWLAIHLASLLGDLNGSPLPLASQGTQWILGDLNSYVFINMYIYPRIEM
jgi:hypothetical protein